jgi:hypothetical protein
MNSDPRSLDIAIRVYPCTGKPRAAPSLKRWRRPRTTLVFDTETRTDPAQDLLFGSYRFFKDGKCLEEGLFYGDHTTDAERAILAEYARTHAPDTDPLLGVQDILLLSRREFLEKLYDVAYSQRALLCAFNAPFDISRVATDADKARAGRLGDGRVDNRFTGGFSFVLWEYEKNGELRENKYRPRFVIKHIDSKRALKGFAAPFSPNDVDLISDSSEDTGTDTRRNFRGNCLDARTLAFVLTDRGHTLESACKAFGIENGKQHVKRHGVITPKYISYNRNDVRSTAALTGVMLAEYDRFGVHLQVTKAYSPASLGKAHLREMNIAPVLERQPNFPLQFLGAAQTAFYGARAGTNIRKVVMPVEYVDFLSMYPTVNSLLGLWSYLTSNEIRVQTDCAADIHAFLESLTLEMMFNQDAWKRLAAFVRIAPDGDILPVRAQYSHSHDWQLGLNHLYAGEPPDDSLWFALPDVAASVLLTGKVPKIIDAFRLIPEGQLDNLKPIMLRGKVRVDPASDDFFRTIIEQRTLLANDKTLPKVERERLKKALKVLANATSYGIFAEMQTRESEKKNLVTCSGIDAEPFTCRVPHPDVPGEYCFPPLASLITSAARLMLAMLERCVTDLGGTYVLEDTDSMAIVSTQNCGLVACPGGPYHLPGGAEAVKALSWEQVKSISARFALLSPYNPAIIPDSILKIESDNFDPKTGEQRQLYCYSISTKRYALFLIDSGEPVLLRKGTNNLEDQWSEHGLGHLLNPSNLEAEDRRWVAKAWLRMIRKALGLTTKALGFESRPAVGRITVSSPAVMRSFSEYNEDKSYAERIKPFSFVLSCHIKAFGHPLGVDPERFHLIAPYETNATRWRTMQWIDRYSGQGYQIMTHGPHGRRGVARVKNYGDVLREYEYHPEAKRADARGGVAGKQTIGLLRRRHVRIGQIHYIGKESNKLEEVESGVIHDPRSVYTEYPDKRRDEWVTKILPVLKAMPMPWLEQQSGLAHSTLQAIRAGRRPHPKNQSLLGSIANGSGTGP